MVYGYIGSYSSLDPRESETYGEVFRGSGYSLAAGKIGATTSIQTANQIAEVEARLKEGMKTVEVSLIDPRVFESVPKEHFNEIRSLAKLSGAEITVHAPIIDPAGFTQNRWSEQAREEAERHLTSVLQRAHTINPDGNIPVTIHASTVPAAEWRKSTPGEKEVMMVVNPQTGEIKGMPREEYIKPGMETTGFRTPAERLELTNKKLWEDTLIEVNNLKMYGDEMMKFEKKENDKIQLLPGSERADFYYKQVEERLREIYNIAYRNGNQAVRESLGEIGKKWMEEYNTLKSVDNPAKLLVLKREFYGDLLASFDNLTKINNGKQFQLEIYKPVEEFAIGHASKTFGNIAWNAYKEFGNKAPLISIENVDPNIAFSRADQLKNLIEHSREKFIENAVASGMKTEKAREISRNIIGATWDTGHIALLKKAGYADKDVLKETEKIAPYVKHVHLNDTFGLEHSDLPPGMGTTPLKKMMEELEKSGFAGKAIVEGGNFVSQFKISPHPYSLEAMGTPIYAPVTGMDGPTWGNAMREYGSVSMGYGPIFPEQHFSMYGAGFTSLPSSLGGLTGGAGGSKQSKFSGAPIE